MPILFRDFESRSTFNLKAVGAWKYSVEPTTDVWCCAYAVDDGPVKLWLPGDPIPPEWIEAASNPDWLVSAYNDQFERLIEQHIMGPRYGWPLVPIERHRCTQAASLTHALPPKLEDVAKALNLAQQKDAAGHKVMMKLAKPRKPQKGENPNGIYWCEYNPELGAYCQQDVRVERETFSHVGHLSGEEQALWVLDVAINDRGVHLDDALLAAASKITEQAHAEIVAKISEITGDEITSIDQRDRLARWLATHGCAVSDMQKETLRRALTRKEISDEVRQVLELRRDGAHVGKLDSMRNWRGADGRARGALKFHGASTGRWTSYGIQLQNMKRPTVESMNAAIDAVATGSLAHVRQHYPEPLSTVGDLARAMICAAPGRRFIAADFSGIESRVTAWISGQQSKIDQWAKFDHTQNPEDEPYFITGTRIFGLRPEIAREPGKTGDLAFGYMGGPGAWKKLAPPGDTSTEVEIKQRQRTWRNAHPQTVKFWGAINRAAIQAVRKPGAVIECGRLAFKSDGTFLRMRLPSGRQLTYPFPRLKANDRGDLTVVFMDYQQGKWTECRYGHGAYGGIWIENAVQAVARDLFAAAMPRLEAAGYPIVLHVHDEIVAEVPDGFGSEEEFKALLLTMPPWATDLPLNAKTRNGPRFCKTKATTEAPPLQPEIGNSGDAELAAGSSERPSDAPIGSSAEHNPPPPPPPPPPPRDEDPPPPCRYPDCDGGPATGYCHVNCRTTPPDDPPPRGNGGAGNGFSAAYGSAKKQAGAKLESTHTFHDAGGHDYQRELKWRNPDGTKHCPQQYRVGGQWVPKKPKGWVELPYRLPDLIIAAPDVPVWITEGPKDAETLRAHGFVATTNAGGAGKFTAEHAKWFTGRATAYILEDNDKAGRAHVATVAGALAGIVPDIRVVSFPDVPGGPDALHGEDVTWWLEHNHTKEELLERAKNAPPAAKDGLELIWADEQEMCGIDWLWPGRFALGKIGLVAGLPDMGKGQIAAFLAAAVTSALALPCDEGKAPQGKVIWFNAEDDHRDTVIPRLVAAGADRKRVAFVNSARIDGKDKTFNLATDLALLRQTIEDVGDVVLVIVDPMSAYLGVGKVDSRSASDVRGVLTPLKAMVEEKHIALIGIAHFNKKQDVKSALLRVSDSIAYVAAARSVYAVLEDPEDKDSKLFIRAKVNIAAASVQGLRYRFGVKIVGHDKRLAKDIDAPFIQWMGPVEMTANEAMAAADGRTGEAKHEAEEFLRERLADGPAKVEDVQEEAKHCGITQATLKRAKKSLGVRSFKERGTISGDWMWEMPGGRRGSA